MRWLARRPMSRRQVVVAGAVALLLLASGLGYRWIKTSTLRSAEEAVAWFRAQEEAVARQRPGVPLPVATVVPTEEPGTPGTSGTFEPTVPPQKFLRRPETGVYSWHTDGYEETSPGARRGFPSESHRIVTHQPGGWWTNHHIYSEEHQEWLTSGLSSTDDQGAVHSRRVRILLGPLSWDRETVYDLPLHVVRSSPKVGDEWASSWADGAGTYTGRTFEHTTVRVGGEEVEVWGNELRFRVSGRERGHMTLRFWWSREHVMTVREEGDTAIRHSLGTYRSEWRLELESLRPKR